jgi:hypothetical protein
MVHNLVLYLQIQTTLVQTFLKTAMVWPHQLNGENTDTKMRIKTDTFIARDILDNLEKGG